MPRPRIPELPAALDARQQAIHDRIAAGPRGRVRGPLALWLYSPDLAERAQHLGEFLRFGSGFEPRLSELVILCVAARHRCRYEWYVHAPIAERNGLAAEAIEAIRAGRDPDAGALKPDEDLVHRFVTRLLHADKIDDALFAEFLAGFGERGVVEVTAIMGYYQIGANLLNAVEYDPPDGEAIFER